MHSQNNGSEADDLSVSKDNTPLASLSEVYRTVPVPKGVGKLGFARKFFAFAGPGYLVAVGYMDPGNWATDIAGGSAFGYTLLSVILISNIFAILLQALTARLGIVSGKDLAQLCRQEYSPVVGFVLWVMCEIAIIATDLAELVGTAVALQLLFGLPLLYGVLLTALDVLLVLYFQQKGFRLIEAFILALMAVIAVCFFMQIVYSQPEWTEVLSGYVPDQEIVQNPAMLYVAIGILGATVMPHNLYLHSSIVQTRRFEQSISGRKEAIRFATIDSTVALSLALFVNSAILIVAAATFHTRGMNEITEIQQAYDLLSPLLGVSIASALFGIALLASGLNSTITATMAGQIVMEGFLTVRVKPWLRRLITRLLAIVPACIAIIWWGDEAVTDMLVLSQVVLSMQLPFAVVPLIRFASSKRIMGSFVIGWRFKIIVWIIAFVIILLNLKLLYDFFMTAG